MNTLISKLAWVTKKSEEILDAASIVEVYFKKENVKFRNVVDGLQTILIEGELSTKTAKAIRHAISTKQQFDHKLYRDLEGFIENGDLDRLDMANAITLAIHYYNNEEHTKILRHLYKTILQ